MEVVPISHYLLNKIEKEVFLNEEDPEDDECLVGSVRQAGSDGSRDLRHLILEDSDSAGTPARNIGVSHSGDCSGLQNRRPKVRVGSSPTAPAKKFQKGVKIWVRFSD